jgi:hypothetical protein
MAGQVASASLLALVVGVVVTLVPCPAKAQDLEDFQICRGLYDGRDYARAVACFEVQVREVPATSAAVLVIESRKYLAAAYMFVSRRDAAEDQLELLLRADPTYELDAASFPVEVVELFSNVRDRLRAERERDAELAEAAAVHARDQARIDALIALAETEVEIEVERSRWVAALPFGVGQFDRGDDGLGAFFLVSESIFFVAAAVSLGVFTYTLDVARGLRVGEEARVAEIQRILLGTEITNWISVGACALLMGAGILEAQLNFQPTRRVRHRRTVPPELLEDATISVSPLGITLRGTF